MQAGHARGELELENLSQERFLASQQGSFNHRHDGMSTRIEMAKRAGAVTPPKRVGKHPLPLYLKAVQIARRRTRANSLKVWAEYRNARDFNQRMKQELLKLKLITRISHLVRKAKKLIGAKA